MTRPRPRIVLLGANGQVGWELARSLQPLGEVLAWGRAQADLAEPGRLAERVREAKPDVIVNAAAYTAVDRAETERALAFTINADAPGALAQIARQCGALLVHYSTDYVFDGAGHEARNEQAPCAPVNAYGESKLAGERAIAEAGGHWLVLRTSWVYGARGANFLRTMLRLAAEREHLRVVADQIGAPTSARLIADATAQILGRVLGPARDDFESEILHLCAAGETSWHGFAEAIIEGWRRLHGAQALAVREVEPIGTKDWPTPAARPLNSRLDCSRLAERHGLTMPDWREGLGLVLGETEFDVAEAMRKQAR